MSNSHDWVTRCPCGRNDDDDGDDMIQCDRCKVWQHFACVGILSNSQVPDNYHCDECDPMAYRDRIAKAGISSPGSYSSSRSAFKGKRGRRPRKNSNDLLMEDLNPEKRPRTDGFVEDENSEKTPMSREERKMQRYLESIARMERMTSGKKGKSTPPDGSQSFHTLPNPNESSSNNPFAENRPNSKPAGMNNPSKRRKNSRAMSISNDDLVDLDVLRKSPDLLKHIYPMSPMYLGRSVWLTHIVDKYNNSKNSGNKPSQSFILPSQKGSSSESSSNSFSYRKKLLSTLK